jgi:hypothetical protein
MEQFIPLNTGKNAGGLRFDDSSIKINRRYLAFLEIKGAGIARQYFNAINIAPKHLVLNAREIEYFAESDNDRYIYWNGVTLCRAKGDEIHPSTILSDHSKDAIIVPAYLFLSPILRAQEKRTMDAYGSSTDYGPHWGAGQVPQW